jgi:hypothetical protein
MLRAARTRRQRYVPAMASMALEGEAPGVATLGLRSRADIESRPDQKNGRH